MIRVSDAGIPCPRCQKNDWCLISEDGQYVACKRVKQGAITDLGKLGFLHRVANIDVSKIQRKERPNVPMEQWSQYQRDFQNQLSTLPQLGLSRDTLLNYGVGWNGQGWTIPCFGPTASICGMQVRFPDGKRCTVTGTRAGVFAPRRPHCGPTWAITEGFSDAGTVFELGLNALGRWNWETGSEIVHDWIGTVIHPILLVIIADNDPVDKDLGYARGIKGAQDLRDQLWDKCRSVILTMPDGIKDIRQFRQQGLTQQKFYNAIQKLIIKEFCKC